MSDTVIVDLTEMLVDAMAHSTGDYSAIHMNGEFARRTRYRERIVHGMLPVALAYMLCVHRCGSEKSGEKTAGNKRLAKLTCRFVGSLRVGDSVALTLMDDAAADQIRFEVRSATDHSLATSGQFVFARCEIDEANARGTDAAVLFPQRLDEQIRSPAGMAAGTEETLAFEGTRACTQIWLDVLPPALRDWFGNGEIDANFSAALSVSTLIGMRLPGRFATFTDLTAEFSANIRSGETVSLRGTVTDSLTSTNRARLALAWIRDGVEVGRGQANTLVLPVNTTLVPIASMKQATSLGIEGKVALVTGASRGIGEVTAKLLAMHGAKTVVHYFGGQSDAQAVVADILENGGTALPIRADLRDAASIERMFGKIQCEYGGVDILVNNAVAQFSPKGLLSISAQDYLKELNVSLFGMHECCRRAIAHMQVQRWGKIVNLGTIVTEVPVTGQNIYITAKAAIGGYTRSLCTELATYNIQANMVLPRMTDTSLIASLPRTLVDRLAEESTAGRLLEPLEVAKVIVFLSSDWANPISGQRIALNQGGTPYL